MASRLVPKTNFATSDSRATLAKAFIAAYNAVHSTLIMANAPASFPGDGSTSVTPAWRNTLLHVAYSSLWTYNATAAEIKSAYSQSSAAADILRKITPDGAYQVCWSLDEVFSL